jgi:hypothetical protein
MPVAGYAGLSRRASLLLLQLSLQACRLLLPLHALLLQALNVVRRSRNLLPQHLQLSLHSRRVPSGSRGLPERVVVLLLLLPLPVRDLLALPLMLLLGLGLHRCQVLLHP